MAEISIGSVINNVKLTQKMSKSRGKVFVGFDQVTNERLVVKVIDSSGGDESILKGVEAESKIGLVLSQKCFFLVKVREILHRSSNIIIIMEYCPEGDLADIITERVKEKNPFSDEIVLDIAFQLGTAVKALHDGDFVHRDLKTDNLFVVKKDPKNFILKVGDFGISRKIESTRKTTTTMMGTIGYTPPDVLDGGAFSKASDIYALGVILIEIMDLLHPFMNSTGQLQQSRIFTGKANVPRSGLSTLQQSLRAFALQMISTNPDLRPTIQALLAHPDVVDFVNRRYAVTKEESLFGAPQLSALQNENSTLRQEVGRLQTAAQQSASENAALRQEVGRLQTAGQQVASLQQEIDRLKSVGQLKITPQVPKPQAKPQPPPAPQSPQCPICVCLSLLHLTSIRAYGEIKFVNEENSGIKSCRTCGRQIKLYTTKRTYGYYYKGTYDGALKCTTCNEYYCMEGHHEK